MNQLLNTSGGEALRDDSNNGCGGDYKLGRKGKNGGGKIGQRRTASPIFFAVIRAVTQLTGCG